MAVFGYVKLLKSVICKLLIWRVLLSHSVLTHKENFYQLFLSIIKLTYAFKASCSCG